MPVLVIETLAGADLARCMRRRHGLEVTLRTPQASDRDRRHPSQVLEVLLVGT